MTITLQEKARANRLAALNAVRSRKAENMTKVEVLRRDFPINKVCEPIFSSCRVAITADFNAAA